MLETTAMSRLVVAGDKAPSAKHSESSRISATCTSKPSPMWMMSSTSAPPMEAPMMPLHD